MSSPSVLHLLSLHGGGVDRHVRDIAARVPRPHLLWHVGENAEVLESPRAPGFLALDPVRIDAQPDALTSWLGVRGVGVAHLHSLAREPRRRAGQVADRLGIPLIVTLHDVQFLRPDAFAYTDPEPRPDWIAELDPFLRRAAAVLAPSDYIAERARREFAGLGIEVVPNGVPTATDADAPPRSRWRERPRPAHVVAMLGAIGPHKGADVLPELLAHLEGSGIGVVVIGYLDRQIEPGWNEETGAFVHGPYDPSETGALLRAYGAELVLFPNHVPESFSYTLSEAWAAGYPVLAAPRGAIGERVRRHGGGWLLAEPFGGAEVARELRRLLSPEAAGEFARVESLLSQPDPARVPTLEAMAETIDAYYRRYGRDAPPSGDADPEAIQHLLAPSLDSSLFRKELAHLADICDDDGLTCNRLRKSEAQARDWIAKLEGDLAAVQAEAGRVWQERCTIDVERERLALELEQVRAAGAFGARLHPFVRRVLAKLLNARS